MRDLDLIRAALGQPKLDYMGFSYGTYIGELYAQMFPGQVRAMVLDGTVDPALSSSATVSGQAKGFETDLGDFFAWCPGNKSCAAELPQGAKVAYEKLFQGLAAGDRLMADLPAQFGGPQQVTPGLAETAAAGSLYSDQTWSYLASGIAQGLAGNGYLLAVLAYVFQGMMLNGQFSNLVAASYAISCADRPYLKTVTAYEQLAARLVKADPDFGGISAWSDVACAYWPSPPRGRSPPFTPPAARPSSSSARRETQRPPTPGRKQWPASSITPNFSPGPARGTPAISTARASSAGPTATWPPWRCPRRALPAPAQPRVRDFVMTFSQLTVQFPHLAAELGQLSGPELDEAVRRVVEEGLSATGLQLTSRSPKDLERLVWSLDDEAWGLQEKAEAGQASLALYNLAFRKARAVSGLLEMVEGRYGPAVYESVQALNADEDAVVQLIKAP